jgi:putative ABC transport system substrate-binding protein
MMRRRDFITLLGSAAAWPLTARAQQTTMPVIGFLGTSTPSGWRQYVATFAQRLRERGWIEGRTVTIEYRWAEGRNERYTEIAAEFVRLKADVIVTSGGAVAAVGDPDCFRGGERSAGHRPSRQSCATGRQRHRTIKSDE